MKFDGGKHESLKNRNHKAISKNVARPSRKISQGHLEKSKNKLTKCEVIFRLINLEAWPRTLIPATRY